VIAMASNPGLWLPFGLVMADEPTNVGITTFAENGEVLMTFNMREGGNVSQVIIGLTPNQAMELIRRLHTYDDVYARAIAEGKGCGCKAPSLAMLARLPPRRVRADSCPHHRATLSACNHSSECGRADNIFR
jgi:hypothetical protein